MPGTGRHAHDPRARGATRAWQRGLGWRALPGGDPEWALHDRGRDRQYGAISLLRPCRQHDRRTVRRRRRAHRNGRRGHQSGWTVRRAIGWVDRFSWLIILQRDVLSLAFVLEVAWPYSSSSWTNVSAM